MRYCEKCGVKIKQGSNFCESCGKNLKKTETHVKTSKERPTFLKILLGFFLVSSIFSILLTFSGSPIYSSLPSFYVPYSIFSSLISIFCVYGLYTWKMWGFYGFVILQILGFILSFSTFGSMALFTAFVGFVSILLLYFAMKPVWDHFE